MWPQDVFKESRSHDHLEAKNDMETHVRSRKLPLTRKIYAFYHAPIVKFWSNTVRENRANTYTCSQFCATIHYGCLSEWDSWYLVGLEQGVSDQDQPLGTQCFFALKRGVQKREVPARPSQVSEMSLPKGNGGESSWAHHRQNPIFAYFLGSWFSNV